MISNREEALTQFLGIDSSASKYPQSFTIPEAIHERALEALSKTVQDGREHSLHFRYRRNQWRGGIAVRGTQTSASFLHTNSILFWPPHVHVHTHPDITDEELEVAIENSYLTGLDSAPQVEEVVGQALQLLHQVPSSKDIFRSLHEPAGSVGHVLISSYGSFAWVHRDTRATKGVLENSFSPRYRRKTSFARNRESYVEERDAETFGDVANMDSVRQQVIQTRAIALEPAYICYANDESEMPELIKVEG